VRLKRTHLRVFIEERRQRSLEVAATLLQHSSADRVTVVEVIVLSHGPVQSVGRLTASELQLLTRYDAIITDDLQQQATPIIGQSLYCSVRYTVTHTQTDRQTIE